MQGQIHIDRGSPGRRAMAEVPESSRPASKTESPGCVRRVALDAEVLAGDAPFGVEVTHPVEHPHVLTSVGCRQDCTQRGITRTRVAENRGGTWPLVYRLSSPTSACFRRGEYAESHSAPRGRVCGPGRRTAAASTPRSWTARSDASIPPSFSSAAAALHRRIGRGADPPSAPPSPVLSASAPPLASSPPSATTLPSAPAPLSDRTPRPAMHRRPRIGWMRIASKGGFGSTGIHHQRAAHAISRPRGPHTSCRSVGLSIP